MAIFEVVKAWMKERRGSPRFTYREPPGPTSKVQRIAKKTTYVHGIFVDGTSFAPGHSNNKRRMRAFRAVNFQRRWVGGKRFFYNRPIFQPSLIRRWSRQKCKVIEVLKIWHRPRAVEVVVALSLTYMWKINCPRNKYMSGLKGETLIFLDVAEPLHA